MKCSCMQKQEAKSASFVAQQLPAEANHQLQVLVQQMLKKIRSLRKLGPVFLDRSVWSDEFGSRCKQEGGSTVPDLSGPVFRRGQHSSQADLRGLSAALLAVDNKAKNWHDDGDNQTISALLEQYVPLCKVKKFIRIVLRRVIPSDLLGKKNTRAFYKAVDQFLHLGRYEKFYVGNLTKGFVTDDTRWMTGLNVDLKMTFLAKVAAWMFMHLVIPLLKGYFYITDTAVRRNHIFYYRKKTWKLIQQKAVTELLDEGHLQEITKEVAEDMITSGRTLGVAYLRFLPTALSLRPIVNLTAHQSLSKTPYLSVNHKLQVLHGILTSVKTKSLLGSSQFGIDDIYKTWRQFVTYRENTGDKRQLYFSKVDIKGCFNSINQHKLFDIIKDLLKKSLPGSCVTRKYCTVFASGGEVKKLFRSDTASLETFVPDFVKFVWNQIKSRQLKDMIFVDQVMHSHRECSELLEELANHIFNGIVKMNNSYYLQTQGIIQGSMISTLLCNYYYGAMERHHLRVHNDELLMRQVDDFLFVTPYEEHVRQFLETMTAGIPEYNCTINARKSLTNLKVDRDDIMYIPFTVYFPWCGMLFDVNTLEVKVDYTRYHGLAIRDILTLELYHRPKENFVKKIISSLRVKCHGMFLDHKINSIPVIVHNTFCMFVLVAYKFHCYAKNLPQGCRVSEKPAFFISAVRALPSYFITFSKKKTIPQESNSPLTEAVVQWICYKAFIAKLEHHKSAYYKLLSWLKKKVRQLSKVVRIPPDVLPSKVPEEFHGIVEL